MLRFTDFKKAPLNQSQIVSATGGKVDRAADLIAENVWFDCTVLVARARAPDLLF
jgi:hypothetical protein